MQVSASAEENTEILEDFGEKLKLNVQHEKQAPKPEHCENEEDFSFACAGPVHSPVSADDAFVNGQIRPIFPIFDQSLLYRNDDVKDDSKQSLRPPLRKLFAEERFEPEDEEEPVGPFCEWSSGGNKTVKEASPEHVKKSNSTGFSKLWRFRELVHRSNSDGKDAFVFLNNDNTNSTNKTNNNNNTCESEKAEKRIERSEKSSEKPTGTKTTPGEKVGKVTGVNKRVKAETVSSVYEKYYVRNRVMREGDKRRTYAPYRQDLVGFFTNVNGFSRNVHPF